MRTETRKYIHQVHCLVNTKVITIWLFRWKSLIKTSNSGISRQLIQIKPIASSPLHIVKLIRISSLKLLMELKSKTFPDNLTSFKMKQQMKEVEKEVKIKIKPEKKVLLRKFLKRAKNSKCK